MQRRRLLAATLGVALAVASLGVAQAAGHSSHMRSTHARSSEAGTFNRHAFHDKMRRLWEDHVAWTRLYIVSAAADLPDQKFTAARLLTNQTQIGNAIKPFYGEEAGDQLTALLRDHILTAAAMIDDAKAGDTEQFQKDSKHWYVNANQIARFLHDANPENWPLADMRSMMKMHLDLTLQEAVDRLQGHYYKDVHDYTPIETEILKMADMLSSGIVHQFPERF